MGLVDHVFLLERHEPHLAVQRLGQRGKQLGVPVSAQPICVEATPRSQTYLGLARLAIMVRHADLVKQAVQLANYGVDLLYQVASIHCGVLVYVASPWKEGGGIATVLLPA